MELFFMIATVSSLVAFIIAAIWWMIALAIDAEIGRGIGK